jgi:maltose O-acetyltransferase
MSFGVRFTIRNSMLRASISADRGAEIHIGDDVFINQGTRIHARSRVDVGNRVEIGDLAIIYDTNFHAVAPGDSIVTEPIIIEDDCWIGSSAIILPGVHLGRGSVVAAGSVVTKSFGVGSLVAGNPARLVRTFEVPADFRRRGPKGRSDD